MARTNDVGLFQLKNKNWGCRIYMKDPSGKQIDTTYRRDEHNEPFTTKKQAKDFRARKILEIQNPPEKPITVENVTFGDVWKTYLERYTSDKAISTVQRYKSLWKNHIKPRFENTTLEELTIADVEAFLRDLYDSGLSYSYVEGFTKFFWMMLVIADKEEWMAHDKYNRMCVDKATKIKMPKKYEGEDEDDEDESIKIFEAWEIDRLEKHFKGSNLYTAFLLGYYLGLRISECFGLMWSDIDWGKHTIRVRRQMVYEEGCFCIKPPKTKAGKREIDIPNVLYNHLKQEFHDTRKRQMKMKRAYRNQELVMDKMVKGKPKELIGGDFINRKANGELLTHNSIKYHADLIKKNMSIDFKYHSLRRTHISMLAAMNTPVIETMKRVGHTKYETTMRYYIAANGETKKRLLENINTITTEEPIIEVKQTDGTVKKMKQSKYLEYLKFTKISPS